MCTFCVWEGNRMGRTENLSTFLDLNCPCADSRRDTGEEKEASEKKESGKYDDRRTSGWSLSWPACLVIIARGRRAGDRRQYELPNPTVLCPSTGVYSHTWPWLLSNLTWAAALNIELEKWNSGVKDGPSWKSEKEDKRGDDIFFERVTFLPSPSLYLLHPRPGGQTRLVCSF